MQNQVDEIHLLARTLQCEMVMLWILPLIKALVVNLVQGGYRLGRFFLKHFLAMDKQPLAKNLNFY